ncbi:cation:proton antiporter [Anabaena lutea]|uniref:Cation:proton antiporter n=1 Tax=Anabaena lutea FACHB-196 TaxID=2692881 RepID=A0ABR8FL79_9NOST|nr:cation:proton antiporter [Anabaena lutea]MBD2570561.1 cation:proton antiporter [Anabaena lutea FACHB-196]
MELLLQVLASEPTSQVLGKEPIVPFAILLVVILVIPILFDRLRLPGLVGLVCAGVVLGPSGWRLLESESPMITLLSDIGLVYLMFIAGLEFNIKVFREQKIRSLVFGSLTFSLPLIIGTLVGRFLGFGWDTSILIGALLASHSLLAYPILSHLGVVNNEAITMTMGATIFTDIGTLLILSVCIASSQAGVFSVEQLIPLIALITIYALIVLVGFDWAGKEFFRRSGDDEGNKFLFVLMSVFVAAVVAQMMGLEKIVGVFLAGLAVNEAVGEGPVKEKLVFIGSVLFIPIFFVDLGSRIDLPAFFDGDSTIKLLLLIFCGLITSKFIAALLAKLVYRYNWQETLTIWSLSIPLVSTTLAVALGGYRSGLLPPLVFNSVIVLMVMTATLGPWLTSVVAASATGLTCSSVQEESPRTLSEQQGESAHDHLTIVVPLYNPHNQRYLIEMAALLACQSNGKILPLAIAHATAQMDTPQLEVAWQRSERLLAKATAQSQLLGAKAEPLLRIDDAFAPGISRAAREQKANLIVMGWGKRTGLRARLLGNVIDSVLWASHCPVAVARLVESPKKIQRILVPIENLMTPTLTPVKFAQMLADANQSHITILNVCDRRTSSSKIAARRSHLSVLVSKLALAHPPEIQIIAHENVAQAILQAARLYDLIVLPFIRNRTSPGGLAISDVTNQLVSQLTCSIIILGEPQHNQNVLWSKTIPSNTASV